MAAITLDVATDKGVVEMGCTTLIACVLLAGADQAVEQPAPAAQSTEEISAARLAKIRDAAKAYTLKLEHELKFQPEPLLRFDDPITKASQGAVYVWIDDRSRPTVMASIYFQADGARVDEFLSLFGKGATAEFNGQLVWQPKEANVELTLVSGAAEVADTAALRLVQMRTLARKFTASVSDRRAGRQELRLLTQPIHRYASPRDGLIDGGVFAFAKGTNPEVLLIIEAIAAANETGWRIGWARMTSRECEVRDGENVVWNARYSRFPQGMNEAYFNRGTRD